MKLLPESPVAFLDPLPKPPETLFIARTEGPFVNIVLAGTEDALVFVRRDVTLDDFSHDLFISWGIRTIYDEAPLGRYIEKFNAYFGGDTSPFEAVVQPFGVTPFTLDVHRFMTLIPYGTVLSYGEVAEGVGNPLASRAVGNACGKNRILIVIPCHRVIASNGIGGFGAGLHVKKRLLRLEGLTY